MDRKSYRKICVEEKFKRTNKILKELSLSFEDLNKKSKELGAEIDKLYAALEKRKEELDEQCGGDEEN